MTLYNEHQHLNKTILQQMQDDVLSFEDKMLLLKHIATCDDCCETYIQNVENLVPIAQTTPLAVQIKTAVTHTKKQKSMLFYNLKIGFALAASLYLVFCFPTKDFGEPSIQMEQNWSRSVSQTVTKLQEKIDIIFDKMTIGGTFFERTEE